MKTAIWVLLGAAVALLAFGGWGRFSDAGRSRYDEMAGMIPYGAWYLGILLLVVAAIIGLVLYFKS